MSVELETNSNITITPRLKSWLDEHGYKPKSLGHQAYTYRCAEAMVNGDLDADTYLKLTTEQEEEIPMRTTKEVDPDELFTKSGDSTSRIRLKDPSEGLSTKRAKAVHPRTGQPVYDEFGVEATLPSERSKAMTGVYLKHVGRRAGLQCELSEWERSLWDEMVHKEAWASFAGDPYENKILQGPQVKALLDESAGSGGLEISPVVFDSDLVWNVLLTGELFPLVTLKPVSRGRRVESASIGTPTVTWGTGEGTEGTLYDFSNYVSAIDTTVYVASAFLEFGRDLLGDSAVDVADLLQERMAERLGNEFDKITAIGNGTTQPEGVMTKAGTTSVSFGNATSMGNYENLLFAVGKQYRKSAGNRFVFCGTETSYQRARALQVSATDQRRLWGMTHESYQLFPPREYRICGDLTNRQVFAGDMRRYRMYRRMGERVEISTEGKSLMRSNTALMAIRVRLGGQVMVSEAFATVSDAPA